MCFLKWGTLAEGAASHEFKSQQRNKQRSLQMQSEPGFGTGLHSNREGKPVMQSPLSFSSALVLAVGPATPQRIPAHAACQEHCQANPKRQNTSFVNGISLAAH